MCILTMKSVTYALRARSALAARGIDAEVVNIDPKLTKKGCAYGIRFACAQTLSVERILSSKELPYGVLMGNREVFGGER